jgi:hypothetical protein
MKLRIIPAVRSLDRAMPRRVRRLPPSRLLHRAIPVLEGQLHADLPPDRLFGSLGDMCGRLDRILFVVSAAGPDTTVEPIDTAEVAARMSASIMHERLDLTTLLLQARFAHPGLRNEHIETMETRQLDLLGRALADRPAYLVTHPYPVDLAALFDAVRPVLSPA